MAQGADLVLEAVLGDFVLCLRPLNFPFLNLSLRLSQILVQIRRWSAQVAQFFSSPNSVYKTLSDGLFVKLLLVASFDFFLVLTSGVLDGIEKLSELNDVERRNNHLKKK